MAAESIPTVENGVAPNLTSITWTLKEGAMWRRPHWRRTPCSRTTAEGGGCAYRRGFDGVENIEAVDTSRSP
jgi:peptide/nickel transport system substrate-binding protein